MLQIADTKRLQNTFLTICAFCLLSAASFVAAHASEWTSKPKHGTTTDTSLEQISLELNEPVVLEFSVFELHKLDLEPDALQKDIAKAADEAFKKQFDIKESTSLIETMLVMDEKETANVILDLPEAGLEPGVYALFWRVLSVDTHITQDRLTFTIIPAKN